jgi:hypothetical protein
MILDVLNYFYLSFNFNFFYFLKCTVNDDSKEDNNLQFENKEICGVKFSNRNKQKII